MASKQPSPEYTNLWNKEENKFRNMGINAYHNKNTSFHLKALAMKEVRLLEYEAISHAKKKRGKRPACSCF